MYLGCDYGSIRELLENMTWTEIQPDAWTTRDTDQSGHQLYHRHLKNLLLKLEIRTSHFRLFDRTALVVGGGVYRHCGAGAFANEGEAIG